MAGRDIDRSILDLWERGRDRYVKERVLACADALARRDFSVLPVPTISEANRLIVGEVRRTSTVYYWEEATLKDLGILETLSARGNSVRSVIPLLGGRSMRRRRRAMRGSDCFMTTVGAVTMDGVLVKLEPENLPVFSRGGSPGQVIVVAGVNKIVDDLEDGLARARDAFMPRSASLLRMDTRCAQEEHCVECDSPPSMCAVSTIVTRKPASVDFLVVLIGEQLGY